MTNGPLRELRRSVEAAGLCLSHDPPDTRNAALCLWQGLSNYHWLTGEPLPDFAHTLMHRMTGRSPGSG